MPRYRYMCNECTLTFTLVHGINEVLVDCPKCDTTQSMEKLLSTPIIIKSDIQISQDKVGELTKEYIEENRRILQEQIKEARSEDYEQT